MNLIKPTERKGNVFDTRELTKDLGDLISESGDPYGYVPLGPEYRIGCPGEYVTEMCGPFMNSESHYVPPVLDGRAGNGCINCHGSHLFCHE